MNLSFIPAVNVDILEVMDTMNQAFANYIGGDLTFSPTSFEHFLTNEAINLNLSQLAQVDDHTVGLAFVSRRGWSTRIAGMGIVPEVTGQGIAKQLLAHMIDGAKQRGDHVITLESIEQNIPAVNLYKSLGFRITRRLVGYTNANPPKGIDDVRLEEVDISEVARLLTFYGADDLPWQCSGHTVCRLGPPNKGVKLDKAHAIITDPTHSVISIRGLVVPKQDQNEGRATQLIRALFGTYPDKVWKVPAICPEETGIHIFENLGFVREEYNQVQMHINLVETSA